MSLITPPIQNDKGFHLYLKIETPSKIIQSSLEDRLHIELKNILSKYFDIKLDHYYVFNPQGSSGSYILAESHANYHTFPEYNYIVIDIYSCVSKINLINLKEEVLSLFEEHNLLGFDISYREN